MAEQIPAAPLDDGADSNHDQGENATVDRVTQLTWALIDEQITREQLADLEALLLSDDAARGQYLRCIQLHTDLHSQVVATPTKRNESGLVRCPCWDSSKA